MNNLANNLYINSKSSLPFCFGSMFFERIYVGSGLLGSSPALSYIRANEF